MVEQGAAYSSHGAANEPPGMELTQVRLAARVTELETENSRLKSLVGELLVANQVLREKNRRAGE